MRDIPAGQAWRGQREKIHFPATVLGFATSSHSGGVGRGQGKADTGQRWTPGTSLQVQLRLLPGQDLSSILQTPLCTEGLLLNLPVGKTW